LTVNVWPAIVSVPVRADVELLAAIENVTEPLPEPEAPVLTVIQLALLTLVHEQPAAAVTVELPDPPAEAIDRLFGEIVGAQAAVNEKVFDGRLVEDPPGPSADTRPSYTTPAVSGVVSSETKSTRIRPSTSSAGLPSDTV
jgi:hypothetical protein